VRRIGGKEIKELRRENKEEILEGKIREEE
jgi:hypothetical protein